MTDYEYQAVRKATTTTILLMPMIGMNKRQLGKYGFLNAYVDDKDYNIHYENAIYLLFKPEPPSRIEDFVSLERESPLFQDEYDYEGGYVVVVYRIMPKWISDYKLWREGKYSKMSKLYQDSFKKIVKVMDPQTGIISEETSLPYHIFNRTEDLREMQERDTGVNLAKFGPDFEYWSIPDLHGRESLDITKIKKYEQTVHNPEPKTGKAELPKDV